MYTWPPSKLFLLLKSALPLEAPNHHRKGQLKVMELNHRAKNRSFDLWGTRSVLEAPASFYAALDLQPVLQERFQALTRVKA